MRWRGKDSHTNEERLNFREKEGGDDTDRSEVSEHWFQRLIWKFRFKWQTLLAH